MRSKLTNSIVFLFFTILLILVMLFFNQMKILFAFPHDQKVSSSKSLTVVLDAGHGGEDGGAIGQNKVHEKDLNLAITLKIGELLKNKGINVIFTRTEDILLYDRNVDYTNRKKSLDLAQRVKIAQNTPDCIFVSIHMNAFPKSQYKGFQVYYSKNNPESQILANDIQGGVKEELQPWNKRKITAASSKIFLLDRLNCPAILIECGFMSNPEECRLLTTEIYQNQLSKIISEKIAIYVEKNLKTY